MELKIEHLAPYLPYELKCRAMGEGEQSFEFQGISDVTWIDLHEIGRTVSEQYDIDDVFPLLKPLSKLNEEHVPEMTIGESILSMMKHDYDHLCNDWMHDIDYNIDKENILSAPAFVFNHLISLHYDVFGLIDEGLAIALSEA